MHIKTPLLVCSASMILMACSTPNSDLMLETSYGSDNVEWRVYSCDMCDTDFTGQNWPDLKQGVTYNITVFRRDTGIPASEATAQMKICDGAVHTGDCVEEVIRKAWAAIYTTTIQR